MVTTFRYLKPALAIVLLVVGGKMLAAEWLKHALGSHFNLSMLAVILAIIFGGVVASVLDSQRLRFVRKGSQRAACLE